MPVPLLRDFLALPEIEKAVWLFTLLLLVMVDTCCPQEVASSQRLCLFLTGTQNSKLSCSREILVRFTYYFNCAITLTLSPPARRNRHPLLAIYTITRLGGTDTRSAVRSQASVAVSVCTVQYLSLAASRALLHDSTITTTRSFDKEPSP